MAIESIISSSREKTHLMLSTLFKNTFGDLSNLDKVSLNAWILERMTDIQRDLSVGMTIERSEQQLNTCRKISTARDIGYLYNFSSINTTPALGSAEVTLALPLNWRDNEIEIKAHDTKLYSGEICYMFPDTIVVSSDKNGYIQVRRKEDTSKPELHVFDTTDKIILYSTVQTDKANKQLLVSFTSEVIQLDYVDSAFIVPDHLELTNSENEVEFEDNFYKISVWYTSQSGTTGRMIKTTLDQADGNDLANHAANDEVYKAEIIAGDKLRITLGNGLNGSYYAPGKEIKYRIYTSKGTAGNILSKDLVVSPQEELTDISITAKFVLLPTGGQDEFDLITLKKNIIKKIQSSDNIITDTDFKNKLSTILGLTEQEVFQKLRRNDPIERIIELFMIVKDRQNNNTVIPTNTLDVILNFDETTINKEYKTIAPLFTVESVLNKTDLGNVRTNKVVSSFRKEIEGNNYYSTFYAIKIQENPLLANFFNLSANYNLVYKKNYDIGLSESQQEAQSAIYINNAILERDIFNTKMQSYNMQISLDAIQKESLDKNLIVLARFNNKFGTKQYKDFIIEFSKDDENPNLYNSAVTSLDVISNSNNLFIKDVYTKEETFTDGTELWLKNTNDFDIEMVDTISCEIGIFYNFPTEKVISNTNFENVKIKRPDSNKEIFVGQLKFISSYIIENINFYRNVDNIIYCQLENNNNQSITIKNMPVFEKNYLLSAENREALNYQMIMERNLVSKVNNIIEFPSRLSLKYFNTYGYSSAYSLLDNVSLKLRFEVSYRNNKVISDSDLSEIKQNLIKYIDQINNRSTLEDKNIYISDLVSIVTNNSNIVQCRVLSYGDTDSDKPIDNIYYTDNTETQTPTSLQLSADNIHFITKAI